MGFVEAVTGEFLHQVENLFGLVQVHFLIFGTCHENLALLGHLFGFFLTHGAAQHIGLTE